MARVVELEALPPPERAEPGRMSTSTSRIAPRAQRTSFAMPGWKCIPRSTPAPGARVVVLHPLVVDAELGQSRRAERLEEEAALVAVHDRARSGPGPPGVSPGVSRGSEGIHVGPRSAAPARATRWPRARARCARAAPARSARSRSRPRACRRGRAPARGSPRSRGAGRPARAPARSGPPRGRTRGGCSACRSSVSPVRHQRRAMRSVPGHSKSPGPRGHSSALGPSDTSSVDVPREVHAEERQRGIRDG